jgi:hydrogenase maturation protease
MSEPSAAPFVVFACGNPSRGDDALGPLLLERLRGWLAAAGWSQQFELIDDFQLQIEHALDLQGRRAALFIDAGEGTPAPCTLAALPPVADSVPPACTHALPPAAVLAVYRRVVDATPPPAQVLCVRGERFELGEGLSAAAAAHLEAAWPALQRYCRERLAELAAGAGGEVTKP